MTPMPNAKTDGASPVAIENAPVVDATDGLGLSRESSLLLPDVDSHDADSSEKSIENSLSSPTYFEKLDIRSIALEKVI